MASCFGYTNLSTFLEIFLLSTFQPRKVENSPTIYLSIFSYSDTLVDFEVIDPNINLSDHLPILATVACKASTQDSCYISETCSKTIQLRWDHADLVSYYNYTDHHLRTAAMEVDEVVNMWNANCSTIDYFITSNSDTLVDFEVIDPNINFSDHLPILATVACKASTQDSCYISKTCSKTTQLRWDHTIHLRTVAMEVDEVVIMWNVSCSTIE